MSTAFYEKLLTHKREQAEHHHAQYLRYKQEADDLEDQLDRGVTPDLVVGSSMMGEPYMSKREKTEARMRQVLALFERKKAGSGIVFVDDVMRECKITKNPAKEWMNARIDMDPDSCPWVRVDGIKTMFALKTGAGKCG